MSTSGLNYIIHESQDDFWPLRQNFYPESFLWFYEEEGNLAVAENEPIYTENEPLLTENEPPLIENPPPLTENEPPPTENKTPVFVNSPVLTVKTLTLSDSNGLNKIRLFGGEVIPSFYSIKSLIRFAPGTHLASVGSLRTAHICVLSICAKEYKISMISGVLESEVVSTSYSNLTRRDGVSSYRFAFPNDKHNFSFFADDTKDKLASTFEGEMSLVLGKVLDDEYHHQPTGWLFPDTNRLDPEASMFSVGFNASADIPKTMDRVATAMTSRLRDISNYTVQGQSGSMMLFVRVSWLWLLLPLFSVVFGTIFLISVMITTRKHKLPIWKASELALLFHGFDFKLDDTVEMMEKVSEMEAVASALQVQLGRGSNGVLKLQRKSE